MTRTPSNADQDKCLAKHNPYEKPGEEDVMNPNHDMLSRNSILHFFHKDAFDCVFVRDPSSIRCVQKIAHWVVSTLEYLLGFLLAPLVP